MLYGLCFILALTESYGLRLRHVVCGIFYPEREKLRAVWLYNHILRTRGGMRRFLRRAVRKKVFGDDTLESISFLDRLAGQSRLIAKILQALGRSKVYCVSCGEPGKPDDYENFKKCESSACKGQILSSVQLTF
ncbi:DC-STAMP domain-containing protein 2 [Nephila pilipes]|uniref:DC-STAMP domain-containing protein 2 n=1 Tax=Nephila pilipes TaxID=299642 RepID=A0A8X6UFB1_NEPPI|nr:DC-STAMP domain-containing protein 2 [Nephila pilipes]